MNPELPIELKGVSFRYGDVPILERVSMTVRAGEYLGVIGPNGGGKTTLLRLMLGLLRPTEGQVLLFGEPAHRSRGRSLVGYVPQRSRMDPSFPATVDEVIMSGRTVARGPFRAFGREDRQASAQAMRDADIERLSDRRIGTLSGGERQRVLIARALASEPSVLFLDEPTTAVDAASQEAFYRFLSELQHRRDLTVVIVSHDVDVVSHEVESLICLNRHMTCHGPAEEIIASGQLKAVLKPHGVSHQHPHPHHDGHV